MTRIFVLIYQLFQGELGVEAAPGNCFFFLWYDDKSVYFVGFGEPRGIFVKFLI